MLCELARTDAHRFRLLEPDSDQTEALRALTRSREDLVAARVALANQLRAELERFWPGPIGLFADLDSPISLAFWPAIRARNDARGLGEKRMAAFLRAHRYSARKTPAQLLAQVLAEQIRGLETEIGQALDAHPDGPIFRSFFRSPEAVICAATLLSEIGDCRRRYPHRDAIAANGGRALVAKESGKPKQATFRWACNKRLRNALSTLAHNNRRWNP